MRGREGGEGERDEMGGRMEELRAGFLDGLMQRGDF